MAITKTEVRKVITRLDDVKIELLRLRAHLAGTVTTTFTSASALATLQLPKVGHKFNSWKGTGTGSFTGTTNPATIPMNSPITEIARFTSIPAAHPASRLNPTKTYNPQKI